MDLADRLSARRVASAARTLACLALAALAGCPSPPPPPVDPVFPADHASTYAEVRDCRLSIEHDLVYVRVLASPTAREPYATRMGDFPEGAVLVKEEYEDPGCATLAGFTAMRRESGDWRWQRVGPDRMVLEDGALPRCAGCHAACGVPPEGYLGTCAVP